MTHLDLFSGIGGFALAARWTGWTTIAFSEIDPYASRVLKRHWPEVPNLGDIRNVRGIRAELVTGGFPCQPFSHAGKRRGTEDDRYLWPEMLRVIAEAQPRWVLGENVAGIVGMALDTVLSDLEAIGYAVGSVVVPACAVDAPHRRDRVWIVAHRDGSEREEQRRPEPVRSQHGSAECGSEAVADAEKLLGNGGNLHAGSDPESCEQVSEFGIRHCNLEPGNRWLPEPDVGRVAHGIPSRVDRLKGLGNAIVPQVAAVILEAMARTP